MLEIYSFRNGEILNARNGKETPEYLEIEINGVALPQSRVSVNGVEAARCDRNFSAKVRLRERINRVTVNAHDKFGDLSRTITLVWDKQSFKRYAARIDDNVFFFNDLAREKPKHAFDHFYLKKLKELHNSYGTKFILKCFFRDDHDPEHFTLDRCPDCWKQEFEDNSDWLHLAFHALSEFPDRPYQHCTEARLAHDLELTTAELRRIAGDRGCTAPTNVHWAMLPPNLFHVMREHGVRILTSSGFMNNRIIQDGRVETISGAACDIGFFYEQDVAQYMAAKRSFYDADHDLFLSRTFLCCNIDTKEELREKIIAEDKKQLCDFLELIGHEQYAFPRYENFLPDYAERWECACRTAVELGYEPVFFNDGIFGNTAWEKTR